MASTYSSLLRAELVATGEKNNTWGGINNTNIGTILEKAIAGSASVTHDDSASYTLTVANGSDDEARCMFIVVGGTLTANRNVVTPSSAKLYIVDNNTTGGFDITVKTSGGTGILVPNGKTKMLRVDGTNVVDCFDDLSSTVTVGESLIISESGTNTLTNKTINLANNTLAGTTAEFNTALSDNSFATLSGTETLTNKTLTSPIISTISNTGVITLPTTTTTLIGAATTDTLTNKTIGLTNNTLSGTTAEFNTALSDGNFATLAGSETLTNKTIALGSNTVSGTTAQFNTALSDDNFVTLTGSETLTNKTLSTGVVGVTQSQGDNSTKLATTAYVDTAVASGGGAGTIAQMVFNFSATEVDAATMPADNTIPQITEGSEVVTASITPTDSGSMIVIDVVVQCSSSSNNTSQSVAVLVDSDANAIGSTVTNTDSGRLMDTVTLSFYHEPGDTSAHTYSVRAGNSTGTLYVNQGASGASLHSTVGPVSSIKLTEILQ